MGRRRRRKITPVKVRRGIPKVFRCPKCDNESMVATLVEQRENGDKEFVLKCGVCGFTQTVVVNKNQQAVDAYNKLVDIIAGLAR
ncbi:MAG: hypothetical protein RXR41_04690 [Candidatus Marsarchaeota archaeon]|jgi:transcription elongation factor Elf1